MTIDSSEPPRISDVTCATSTTEQLVQPLRLTDMLRNPTKFGIAMATIDEALSQLAPAKRDSNPAWKAEVIRYLVDIWPQITREAEWLLARAGLNSVARGHLRGFTVKAHKIYVMENITEWEIKDAIAEFQAMAWQIQRHLR
jgi:hypothetical protein